MDRVQQSDDLPKRFAARKIGIDAVNVTMSDATGMLPQVKFSDLYFDFESLLIFPTFYDLIPTTGSLTPH